MAAGPLFEQTRQQIGRVLGGAWYDDSTLPGELVIGEVEERRPMSTTEVLRVVRGIQRAHRHDESEAVGGSHLAAAPRSSEADQTLRCNQPGIGASDGFSPHVVLLNPEQPPTGECRHITAYEASRSMLHASAISTAHRLMGRSATRAALSLMWVNSLPNPVRAWISSSASGKSMRGRSWATCTRSASNEGGSSSLSKGVSTSRSRPPVRSIRTAVFVGRLAAIV